MGLLFNDTNEIKNIVEESFGDTKNHLVAIKHNDAKSGLGKLLISNLFYIMDSNRTFIIYFSKKGIYEREISNKIKGDFYLIPENEIESFKVDSKSNKTIISFEHIGKKISYEIPHKGKIFEDNKINLEELKNNNWNIIF